jgi:hypothetical protein
MINMKNLKLIISIDLIIILILLSCKSTTDLDIDTSEFLIVFSDGTIIKEKEISYYDSSTCILFLKDNLRIIVGEGEPPESCTQFSIYVNDEIIFNGGLYPDYSFSSIPLNPIYISSKTYPILESSILPFVGRRKVINDPRIINSLEESSLLCQGVSCAIDTLKIVNNVDTCLEITITFQNPDNINYYIPDPNKMTVPIFNAFAGITLYDVETDELNYTTTDFWITSEWNFNMSDLSLIEKKDKKTYTYKSPVFRSIETGLYDCGFMIDNNRHFLPIPIPLTQENGKVWVGYCYAPFKWFMIE